jgi:transposase
VRSDYHAGTTWAPVGQTPTVVATGERARVNIVSSVNARGGLHFRLVESGVTASVFIDYLRDLLADVDAKKIFLVCDGHPAHRAKETKEFVAATDRLELFYLPGYAPDLNPDEWVNKNIKHDNAGKAAITKADQLYNLVHDSLTTLQQLPSKIRSFFRDPHLTYIQHALKSSN